MVNTIDVAINLHRMELDRYGRIYVSSRGDYYGTGSDIYVIDAASERVIGSLGIAASEMCIDDDRLYIISTEWSYTSQSNEVSYAVYDTAEQRIVSRNFITDGTDREIVLPYGVAVNPETKELYVCDATNYVTPGYLYCFSPEGSSAGGSARGTSRPTSPSRPSPSTDAARRSHPTIERQISHKKHETDSSEQPVLPYFGRPCAGPCDTLLLDGRG